MEKKDILNEVGNIYNTLYDSKNKFAEIKDNKMALRCEKARNILHDIMNILKKSDSVGINNKILVNSTTYTKDGKKKKVVVLSLYKDNDDCEILTILDYPLIDLDMNLAIDWLCKCAKENPDKVLTFVKDYIHE